MTPVQFDGTWFDKESLVAVGSPIINYKYEPTCYFIVKLAFGVELSFGYKLAETCSSMHEEFVNIFFKEIL